MFLSRNTQQTSSQQSHDVQCEVMSAYISLQCSTDTQNKTFKMFEKSLKENRTGGHNISEEHISHTSMRKNILSPKGHFSRLNGR